MNTEIKLAALCATAGRHAALERSVGFFLAQDNKDAILIIYNNSEIDQGLSLNIPVEDRKRIILINNHIDQYTGKPYTSVGAIWRDAVSYVPKYINTIAIWNDDDYYLSNHISEGIKGMERGQRTAYKPLKSIAMQGEGFKFDTNNFESSIFVKKEHLEIYGFSETDGDYDLQWLNPLIRTHEIFIDPDGPSTMIYDWGGDIPVYKVSGDMFNPDNFANIRKGNNDHGDNIITPADITKYYNNTELLNLLNKTNSISLTYPSIIDYGRSKQPDIFEGKKKILDIEPSKPFIVSSDSYYLSIGNKGKLEVPIYDFERPNTYDVIIADNSVQPTSMYPHSIKNIASSLKVGGTLLMSHEGTIDNILKQFPENFFSEFDHYQDGNIINFYGIKALEAKNYNIDDLVFLTAQPDDRFFVWETEVQINNLKRWGLDHKLQVVVYWERTEQHKSMNHDWLDLQETYPQVKFTFYKADLSDTILQDRDIYSSSNRPYALKRYWKDNPEMQDKCIFYMDSDVIFVTRPNIEEMLKTQNCFVTNTSSYLGVNYMREKALTVNLPQDHFIDIAASIVGISKQTILDNDKDCGGAQYVLKQIPQGFWDKVQKDCVAIRQRFAQENALHFQEEGLKRPDKSAENAGIQSWCADMWAVLYNLYYFGLVVKSPRFMDSAWAGNPIAASAPGQSLEGVFILHNTGVGGTEENYQFQKINYRWNNKYMNRWPWDEDLSYVSPDYYSSYYAKEINELKIIKNKQ